jgi:hypothetical protein
MSDTDRLSPHRWPLETVLLALAGSVTLQLCRVGGADSRLMTARSLIPAVEDHRP